MYKSHEFQDHCLMTFEKPLKIHNYLSPRLKLINHPYALHLDSMYSILIINGFITFNHPVETGNVTFSVAAVQFAK